MRTANKEKPFPHKLCSFMSGLSACPASSASGITNFLEAEGYFFVPINAKSYQFDARFWNKIVAQLTFNYFSVNNCLTIFFEPNILNFSEQQYFVWDNTSQSAKRQEMLEIWWPFLLAMPMPTDNLLGPCRWPGARRHHIGDPWFSVFFSTYDMMWSKIRKRL